MFSVICIIAFLLFVENITPETHFLSREMINAVVFGWLGLYLLRLYWSYSQKESGGTKDEQYKQHNYGKGGKAFPPQLKEVEVSTP